MGCVGLVTISIHLYRMLNIYLSTYPRITISFTILTVSQCFILQWSSKFTRHFPKAPFHESYPALIVDVLVRKLHFIFVSTCLIGCNMQPRTPTRSCHTGSSTSLYLHPKSPPQLSTSVMRSARGLLAVSGRHARATPTSTTAHYTLLARALQILAQPEPVRLRNLSAPDSGA
jgi:hypothetical protein